ncbi:hypothetical protein NN561_007441 [Cricetulus griseus]
MRCRVSFIRGAIKDDDYLSFWVKREENRNQPWGMGGGGDGVTGSGQQETTGTDSGSAKDTEERRLRFSQAGSRERPGGRLQQRPGRLLVAPAARSASVSPSLWSQREALNLRLMHEMGGASAPPPTSPAHKPRLCARLPRSRPPAQSAALSAQRSRRLCGRWRPSGTLASRGARRPGTCAARERALSLLSQGRTGSRRLDGDSPPLPPGGKDPRAPSRAGWRRWPRRRREERYSPVATVSPPAEAGLRCAWLQRGGGSRVPGHGGEIRTHGLRELLSGSSGYRVGT